MIKANMQVHSKYSWNSKLELEEIVNVLLQHKCRYVGIADRVELDREEISDVVEKFKIRNLEIDELNKKYEGQITLLKSAEISKPYLYKEQIKKLNELDLDYTIGTIDPFSGDDIIRMTTREETTREYYKRIIRMIEEGQVDAIGNLDYVDLYFGKDYSDLCQISGMMHLLNETNRTLLINTSAERKAGLNVFPSLQKLCLYRLHQDQPSVIIGSDARQIKELTDNFEQADIICQELGLVQGVYQKRKFERI